MEFTCSGVSSTEASFPISAFSVLRSDSTSAFPVGSSLSPASFNAFSTCTARASASFRVSTASLRILSCASNSAASLTAFSISASLMLEPEVMVMCCSFPVPRSFALTLTIPLASISKVTSICGMPLGAGAMPSRRNCPNVLLSLANSRSPCTTWISTALWLSAAVEKIWLFLVGIVVFLSISLVATPPRVSMESDSGVTSRRSTSPAPASPASLPPWIAAPIATHSSGFKVLLGSCPVSCFTFSCTDGIRVEPPTRSTLPNSEAVMPASRSACCTGPAVASTRSWVSSSNLALVRFISRCFGPSFVAVMNGRLMFVVVALESSFFAFSAASRSLCRAILSVERSMPSCALNCEIR